MLGSWGRCPVNTVMAWTGLIRTEEQGNKSVLGHRESLRACKQAKACTTQVFKQRLPGARHLFSWLCCTG